MLILIFAVLGLVIGSFLNALIYRLKSGEKIIIGRSHCPNCRQTLAVKDLIPLLSFFVLKRQCRYCQKPISICDVIVELFTDFVCCFSTGPETIRYR